MKSTLLTLAGLTAAITPAAAWPFTLRTAPVSATAGERPQLAAANLNNDSRLEWYAGGDTIITWPAGSVNHLPDITLPSWPSAIAVPLTGIPVDVDMDGDMDIVRIDRWINDDLARSLQVFLNNGSGVFYQGYQVSWEIAPVDFAAGTQYRIVPGDFDRDGDPDLVISTVILEESYTSERGTVGIRWNKGNGTGIYDTATALKTNGVDALTVLVGDIDRDGDDDIFTHFELDYNSATGTTSHFSKWYLNSGTGTFTTKRIQDASLYGGMVDVNRDGWLDMPRLALWQGTSYLHVGHNLKDGTFYDFAEHACTMSKMCFADINEDGILDAVGIDQLDTGAAFLKWMKGNAAGEFEPEETLLTLPLPASPEVWFEEIAAADHDQDGDMDLLLFRPGNLYLVENQAIHRRPAWIASSLEAGVPVTDLESADINGDGKADLLAVAPADNQIRTFRGQGTGHLTLTEFKSTNGEGASCVVAGDWDRDGDTDIAYSLPAAGVVRKALNTNPSTAYWPDTQIASVPGADCIRRGSYGAHDGDADLVVSSKTNGQVRWLRNNGMATSWSGVNMANALSPVPASLAAGSLTSKTGDEIFYVTAGGQVKAWHNNGSGTPLWSEFAYQQVTGSGVSSAAVAVMDVYDTAAPEIVFSTGSSGIYWWQPALQNSAPHEIATLNGVVINALTPVDWDRDGLMDILCAHSGGVDLLVRRGSEFIRAGTQTKSGGCKDVVAIDLNRDGLMDAVAGSQTTGSNLLLLRNTSGIITEKHSAISGPLHIIAGQTSNVFSLTLENPGRAAGFLNITLADPPVTVQSHTVRLYKGSKQNGGWVKGAPMTAAEAQEAIASVQITTNNTNLGSASASTVGSGGTLLISVPHGNELSGAINPGTTRDYTIRLTLKPTAGNASYEGFYIELSNEGLARVFDGANPVTTETFGKVIPRIVVIDPLLTPLQTWRKTHFGDPDGTGNRANDADYDSDGVPNLVEYVTGTNPALNEPALNTNNGLYVFKPATMQAPLKFRLIMNTEVMSDPKIKLTVQVSALMQGWATLARLTGGGGWTHLQPDFAIPANGVTSHIFTTTYTPQNTKEVFLRLKVEELP